MNTNYYLNFSDAAKFADIARDLVNGLRYGSNFSFWTSNIFEIVAASYFASLKKRWASVVMVFLLILMYFAGVLVAGFLIDYFVLMPLSGKFFLYSIIGRGIGSSFNQSAVASDALRGLQRMLGDIALSVAYLPG